MTDEEMRQILSRQLDRYRAWSYAELAERVERDRRDHDCLEHIEGVASDGTPYQIELNALWDDKPGGDVRVCGFLSAEPQKRVLSFLPIYLPHLSDSFLMSPDGRFVGESGESQ